MIAFVKAHACGNDFLVVKQRDAQGMPLDRLTRSLCSRHRGVGADGVEFLSRTSKAEGSIHLRNADGSIAEISGNGTRCVAAWMAYEADLGQGDSITLTTDAGLRSLRIVSRGDYRFEIASTMGVPEVAENRFRPAAQSEVEGIVVSTGNPHFVLFTENEDFTIGGRAWQAVGAEFSVHPSFPRQTNVEFVRKLSDREIEIRIFERGVGPTTSSGTGSCASAAAAMRLLGCSEDLGVTAPGGRQVVHWEGLGREMLLTGPAELVARGQAFSSMILHV